MPVTDGSPSSPDARGRGALRALLEVRGFAPLTVGFGLSELVDSMAAVGLVLFLLQYFHDPALAGFLLAARSVPRLLTGLFAGIWLDRVRRRTRLIALDLLVGGSVLLLLPVLARTGHLSIAGLAMLLALAGATAPLNLTGFRSLTPSLVPLPLLSRANAVDSVLGDSGAIVGPAIAAAMVSLFGASGAVTAQGILSLLAAAMVLRVPDLHQPAARSVRSALVTVGDQLLRNRALQATIANMSLGYVGFGILQLTLPLIAEQRFHTGGQSAGLLWAALSAGSVAGALVYGALRPRGSDALHMVAGTALIGPPLLALALAPALVPALAAAAVAGLFVGPSTVAMITLRQRAVPAALRGSLFGAAISINLSGYPLGAAVAGILAAHVSLSAVAALGALCPPLAAAVAWLLLRSRRPAPGPQPS